MKKRNGWWMGALLALAISPAWAAESDEVALSVTLSNAVSVLLPTATYDFGPIALGGQSVNTTVLPVNNNSGGIREDYSLSMVDAAGGWAAVTGAPGTDQYAIQAVFASLQPGHGDFAANDDLAGGAAPAAASATAFAVDAGAAGEKGYDVDDITTTHERTLWLRLRMPTGNTVTQSNPFATVWVSAAVG